MPYTNGFLTGVPSFASSITYHPNGMVNQVVHANGVTDTCGKDPNDMARPAGISWNDAMRILAKSGGGWSWSKDDVDRDCLETLAARGSDRPDPLDPD